MQDDSDIDEILSLCDEAPLSEDPELDWIEEHPEELEPYLNQYVAIIADRGVVAHSPDYEGLVEEVDRLGLREEVLCFYHKEYPGLGHYGAGFLFFDRGDQ